jgi:hypothetical protein
VNRGSGERWQNIEGFLGQLYALAVVSQKKRRRMNGKKIWDSYISESIISSMNNEDDHGVRGSTHKYGQGLRNLQCLNSRILRLLTSRLCLSLLLIAVALDLGIA